MQRPGPAAARTVRGRRARGRPGGEAQALGLLGGFRALLGQYDPGLPRLFESLRLASQLEHAAGISASERMISAALLELLALDEAAGAGMFADVAALGLTQALVARRVPGDVAEADGLLRGLLAHANPDGAAGGDGASSQPASGRIAREAQSMLVELELAQGNARAALDTLEPLITTTCHLPQYGLSAVPRIAFLLGEALTALGRTEDPNHVSIDLEFMTEAEAAGQLGAMRKVWERVEGRVVMKMQARIAEVVETHQY